tara:strand:- start:284 stop:1162 length:879 start_codon:yes stop_codon:yes gene_type:complete
MKERKQPQDRHVGDEPGTQPKKYFKGLSIKDKEARAKYFKKGGKGPAPGDIDDDGERVKTKPSKHTLKFKKMFGESNPDKSLNDKSKKSGIPVGILKQVFKRGVKAWQTGHRPGTTAVQWGHARVNSFITKGKGTWGKADKDLADKVRKSEQVEAVSRAQQAAIAISKKEKAGKPGYDKHGKSLKNKKKNESLWDNIRKKRARIAKGSGEKMGPKGSVPQKNFKSSEKFSDSPRADAARKRKNKMKGKKYKGESLWDNIRKKRERIKKGSGEKMRKKGEKGAPTDAQIKRAQ